MFSVGPSRRYITGNPDHVVDRSGQNGGSPRQSRKKGSPEDLLGIIVIYCDNELLYKK